MRKLILPLLLISTVLAGCSTAPATPSATAGTVTSASTAATATASTAGEVTCAYPVAGEAAKKVDVPATTTMAGGTDQYVIDFNGEPVQVSLDRERTPCTVNSFESLAQQGYFDDTSCHRLVDASGLYVLQCGDPTGTGSGGPGYSFNDELDGTEAYSAGTLAMANAGADTNGSQFFIVYADSQLPASYTVFGKLDAAGIKTVAAIAEGGQDGSYPDGSGVPNSPAVIKSVKPA